jgi:hypothetical protein
MAVLSQPPQKLFLTPILVHLPHDIQRSIEAHASTYWRDMDRYPPWIPPSVAAPPGEVFKQPSYPHWHPNHECPLTAAWPSNEEALVPPYDPIEVQRRYKDWLLIIYGPDGNALVRGERNFPRLNQHAPRYSGYGIKRLESQALGVLLRVGGGWCNAIMAHTWKDAVLSSVLGQIETVTEGTYPPINNTAHLKLESGILLMGVLCAIYQKTVLCEAADSNGALEAILDN